MKKITRIYSTDEVARAFWEGEKLKEKGYEGTMSFVRGRKTADIKVKIEYVKKRLSQKKGKK